MNFTFVVNALTNWATLLGNYFGKVNINKIMLDLLFISMENTSQYGGVPCHLNSD